MKFGIRGQLTDIITYVKFLVNRFSGYRVLTPQNCPFPLTCCVALTTVYALPCDTVIVQTWRLRLAAHVLRLPDVRPACVAMTWIPESGRRTRGRPQKTWRTSFKEELPGMNLTWQVAKRAANDRHRWRNLVAQCRPGQEELSLSSVLSTGIILSQM